MKIAVKNGKEDVYEYLMCMNKTCNQMYADVEKKIIE